MITFIATRKVQTNNLKAFWHEFKEVQLGLHCLMLEVLLEVHLLVENQRHIAKSALAHFLLTVIVLYISHAGDLAGKNEDDFSRK